MYLASVKEVLDFITLVRESVPNATEIFTKGNCTSFARILNKVFPNGTILHNIDHAVYNYNKICYDITGVVKKPKGAIPIKMYGKEKMKSLMKNNYKV